MQAIEVQEILNNAVREHEAGRLGQAEELYKQALEIVPNHPAACHSLAVIANQRGQFDLAIELGERAIKFMPTVPQFYFTVGLAYAQRGKQDEAIDAFKKAVVLKPDYAEAYYNLGFILNKQKRCDEAIENYRKTLQLRPEAARVYNDLAAAQIWKGDFSGAVESCKKAVSLKPDYAEAYNTMASAMTMQGEYQRAIETYGRAIEIDAGHIMAHFNRGLVLLMTGDFETGWREYAWRLKVDKGIQKIWDGSVFEGKRLLVRCEQGMGDSIHFIRYLPMVKERGGTVIYMDKRPLLPLLRQIQCIDELVEDSATDICFDYQIPLLSLPGIFNTSLTNIPANVPYIYADKQKSEYWKGRLHNDSFNVGIVWAGAAGFKNDHNRSCRLEYFVPLTQIRGIRLYSLQKGERADDLQNLPSNAEIENLGKDFDDFSDTAAAIANLDLIISVDTAVLHLAGAMGRPAWALLPMVPDWRWMLNCQDSPWYPTMRLFRQKSRNDWSEVFARVGRELAAIPKN